MAVTHAPYKAKRLLSIYRHIDGGWFWNKYSAYPYVGCHFGCEFCYEREPQYLEAVVKMTRDCGGSFVLAGSLTLSGYQKERYMSVVPRNYPELMPKYDELYQGDYQPSGAYWGQIANKVRELCHKHGIKDGMPRWIAPGALSTNKRIAEKLFLKVYALELEGGK